MFYNNVQLFALEWNVDKLKMRKAAIIILIRSIFKIIDI